MTQSDQVPTQSGFGAKTEAAEVLEGLDLSGKVAIVTGGYSGIGLETSRELLAKDVRVIVPVRNPDKAKEALAGLDGRIETAPHGLGRSRLRASFRESNG